MSVAPNTAPTPSTRSTSNLNNLDPNFSSKVNQLIEAVRQAGGNPQVTSGYRTLQEQTALYKSGNGGVPVAKPGTSLHEKGLAADITGDAKTVQLLHSLAPHFGLDFPFSNDPVHVQLAGQSSGSGGGGSGPSAGAYMTPQTQNVQDYIAQNYGWAASYINIPEIGDILKKASAEQWGQGQLQQAIYATNWWKSRDNAQREWEALQTANPEEANQRIREKNAIINDLSKSLGINIDSAAGEALVRQALSEGWNDAQLNDAIVSMAKSQSDVGLGSIQTTEAALSSMADEYGINLDPQTKFDWARQVAAGEKQVQDFTPQLQTWAMGKYQAWAPQIQAGYTVKQLADPYKQDAAKLLEVTPDSIDLFNNPQWQQALSYADPKSGEIRPMTLSEWGTYVRSSGQWKGTQQGQQAASNMAEGLLNAFGKVKSGAGSFGQ